jgi:hypothetical protein
MADPGQSPESAARRKRQHDLLYALAFVVIAVRFVVIAHGRGYRFPVPWPDEGSFLWQALSFRDHFDLFARELNPFRPVLWMPPGFMVLEGLFFKLVPFSLPLARLLSAFYMAGAVLLVGALAREHRARYGVVVLAAIFFSYPIFILAGNTARMEPLVLLLAALGFFLLDRGSPSGLGVFALAPLVHPNGAIECAMGGLYFLVAVRGKCSWKRSDLAVFGAALAAWIAYGVYVLRHLAAFREDMHNQFRWKSFEALTNGGFLGRLSEPMPIVVLVGLAAAIVLARQSGARVGALAAFAAPLLLQRVVTVGWMYDIYLAFGLFLTSIVVVEASVVALGRTRTSPFLGRLGVVSAACGLAVLLEEHPLVMKSVGDATISRPYASPEYVISSDLESVRNVLRGFKSANKAFVVQCLPDADALFFEDLRSPSLQFVQQTFYQERADAYVVHQSVWVPSVIADMELANVFLHYLVPVPIEKWPRIVDRDQTERWLVFSWGDPHPAGTLPDPSAAAR